MLPRHRNSVLGTALISCLAFQVGISLGAELEESKETAVPKLLNDQQERYLDATNLTDAIAALKDYLRERKRPEYARLFSKESIKAAIASSLLAEEDDQRAGVEAEYFAKTIAPLYGKIANGAWPKGAYFYCRMHPRERFSSFQVDLIVDLRGVEGEVDEIAAGLSPVAYGIQVLHLSYGREPPSEGWLEVTPLPSNE